MCETTCSYGTWEIECNTKQRKENAIQNRGNKMLYKRWEIQ